MRAAERRWGWIPVVAGLLLAAWWLWPRPAPPPAPEPQAQPVAKKQPRAVRRSAPRSAPVPREAPPTPAPAGTPAPPPPVALPAAPVLEAPTLTPEPTRYAQLEITVLDTSGNLVRPAVIASEDCDFWRRAFEGQLSIQVEAKTCTVRAGRMDGPLMTWSERQTVDLSDGEGQALILEVPVEKTAGMGMQIREHDEGIAVQWVMPGSPAMEAGLQPGDVVLEVDGEETSQMSVPDFIEMGTGEAGTEVELVVLRRNAEGEEEEQEVTLVRRLLGQDEE